MKGTILVVSCLFVTYALPAQDRISIGDDKDSVFAVVTANHLRTIPSSNISEFVPPGLSVRHYSITESDRIRITFSIETNKVKALTLTSTPGQYSQKGSRVIRKLEFLKFEPDGYIVKVLNEK